ncbi:hypothetical protein HHUSO_G11604 [Huso huso]|uniref:Uncharacterized protein n=1 Tax=Huso huso TaxID=61971 RepID=A0ABR0ZMD2_HUSHU
MAALLGSELATNWKGLGSKRSFYDFKLQYVVVDAVHRNHLTKKAQDSEIETVAMLWHRNVRDRAVGRKEHLLKAMRKQQQEQNDI